MLKTLFMKKLLFLIIFCIISAANSQNSVTYSYRSNSNRFPALTTRNLSTDLNVDFSIPVIVLTHGWMEDITTEWYAYISDTYFRLMKCTIIFTDWSQAEGLYLRAAFSVRYAGDEIGNFLVNLQQNGLHLEKLHMIGFSLGAHVTSNAARMITSKTGLKVNRISALDPAGPLFNRLPDILQLDVDLDSTDAVIVDVLHTSLILGETKQIGTVDVYANGLFLPLQPGCLIIELCSHYRAPLYFNESILSCGFVAKSFNGNEVVYGEHMPPNAMGTYFLDTNSEYPFSKDNDKCF